MKKLLKKSSLLIMAAIILVTTTVSSLAASTQVIYPAYSDTSYTLTKGGEWIRTNIVSTSTSESIYAMPSRIIWYSPDQVKAMYDAKSHFTSSDKYVEAGTLALETAASVGIEAAKKAIINKYGQVVLNNLLPFLGAVGWLKTGCDLLKILNDAMELQRLEKAIKKNTGLVYITNGYLSWWDYWNSTDSIGNGQFGSYPTAKIPNVGSSKDICYGKLYKNLTN